MIAMQYKILLPADYNMNIIKSRVADNGYKTDGFEGLKYKFYLITEKGEQGAVQNSYCPLYLWKESGGMNKFLFEGFYDNIIGSFGWQRVHTGVPLIAGFKEPLKDFKYLYEKTGVIKPQVSLNGFKERLAQDTAMDGLEYVAVYNPDLWTYNAYYFLEDPGRVKESGGTIYRILHISR